VAGVQNCLRGKKILALEAFEKVLSRQKGVSFKIISSATDGVSRPKAKAETQVRATQMQSNMTRTCC